LLAIDDSDGDGVDDLAEGFGDTDGDFVPDYLDADNRIERLITQSVNPGIGLSLMTDTGLTIKVGPTALAAGKLGAIITHDDIENHGSVNGANVSDADDGDYDNVGGYFNFEVSGLTPVMAVAHVVIPLQTSIRPDSVYRKYIPGTGWQEFVINIDNNVQTAPGLPGACPEPGSALYVDGLTPFSNCLQLTIEDGGPNDADGERNGRLIDPGGVGSLLEAEPEVVSPVVSKGGTINLWFLCLLISSIYLRWKCTRCGSTK